MCNSIVSAFVSAIVFNKFYIIEYDYNPISASANSATKLYLTTMSLHILHWWIWRIMKLRNEHKVCAHWSKNDLDKDGHSLCF